MAAFEKTLSKNTNLHLAKRQFMWHILIIVKRAKVNNQTLRPRGRRTPSFFMPTGLLFLERFSPKAFLLGTPMLLLQHLLFALL